MRVRTPLHVPGPGSLQEKWHIVMCIVVAILVAAAIAGDPHGWIEVDDQLQWTVGSCLFSTSEVEHVHCFGGQLAHDLRGNEGEFSLS